MQVSALVNEEVAQLMLCVGSGDWQPFILLHVQFSDWKMCHPVDTYAGLLWRDRCGPHHLSKA